MPDALDLQLRDARGRRVSMREPFRTASGRGRIDTARRPVTFRFDGKTYTGAARRHPCLRALLANGVHLVGRSFKYHRPRGIMLGSDRRRAERAR